MDILETVRPFLKKLSEETGETVHFVQLDGLDAVYIYKEESYQNSIRMVSKVGSRIPLYCSGVGKSHGRGTCRKPKSKKSGTTAKSRN